MSDMQVSVRFGRKAGMDAPAVLSLGNIVFDDFLDKVQRLLFRFASGFDFIFGHLENV